MSSFYSVIRYVPDPIANESINIGVVVFGEGKPTFRFLKRWNRAHYFGKETTGFLREFADSMSSGQIDMFDKEDLTNEDVLKSVLGRWRNSVQFTSPRGSLRSPDQLLGEVVKIYLREAIPQGKNKRILREQAVALAARTVHHVIADRFGAAGKILVKRRFALEGNLDKHDFDLVIANGSPYLGAYALSFQVPDTVGLRREIDAAAFALEDVRKADRRLPLAVVAVPSKKTNDAYDRAKRIFRSVGAQFIEHEKFENFSTKIVKQMPQEVAA